ncbi:hypothetical protein E3P92_02024 [Wallemia ichthyophaga]|nr:hypothetical protein E3P92_02024 [Wallemia ichthyophaga]
MTGQQQHSQKHSQQNSHQPYPKPSEGTHRSLKNDKPVWESWKSTAIHPRNRLMIASSVFVFSAIGLYVSEQLEDKYPAINLAILPSVFPTMTSPLVPSYTPKDYGSFFLSGATCCTLSHGFFTPFDVIKTRIQVDSAFRGANLLSGAKQIASKEVPSTLLTGFGPTAVGYFFQGGLKFGFYEYFKRLSVLSVGSHQEAVRNRTMIYLTSAASAELVADVALAPLEATRIRLVSDKNFGAKGMVDGFLKLAREGGFKVLYAGFVPLIFKQVPYAVGQFMTNEFAHNMVNRSLSSETRKQISNNKGAELTLTLGCGLAAGVAAAVLSHPGDTLMSKISGSSDKNRSATSQLIQIAKKTGFTGLWQGLGARTWMTAGLVSSQFFMYKAIKDAIGAPPGVEIDA